MIEATMAAGPRREPEWVVTDWQVLRTRPDRMRSALALVRAVLAEAAGNSPFTLPLSRRERQDGVAVGGDARTLRERVAVRGELASAVLLQAIRGGCAADAAKAAEDLAGLGEGSTPSGDDFLVGVMYALHATRPPGPAAALCAALAAAADRRTTRLSAQWLRRAAGGETIPTWSLFFSAVAAGEAPRIRDGARRVAALGHTSGRAALAGLVAAGDALMGDPA